MAYFRDSNFYIKICKISRLDFLKFKNKFFACSNMN